MSRSSRRVATIVFGYVAGASAWIFFSDRLLSFLPPSVDATWASTAKGMLFIVVTGALLHAVLRRFAAAEDVQSPALRKREYWTPLVAVMLVAGTVVAIFNLVYRTEVEGARDRTREDLRVVASIEANATIAWLSGRAGALRTIAGLPLVRIVAQIPGRAPAAACSEVTRQRERASRVLGFVDMRILRDDGSSPCGSSATPRPEPLSDSPDSAVRPVTWIGRDGGLTVTLGARISGGQAGDPPLDAMVVADMRLDETLFVFLRTLLSPGIKETTLLVRRDGDGWVTVFDREQPIPTGGGARFTGTTFDRDAAAGTTTITTIAYRDRIWLAAATPIAGTDWLAVAAVEEAAMASDLQVLLFTAGVSLVVAFGSSIVVAFLLWQGQTVRAARAELEQSRRAQAAETLYRATFEAVDLGIVHLGCDGSWLRSNPALARIAGRPAEDFGRVGIRDVMPADDADAVLRSLSRLASGEIETLSAERRLLRPDGTVVPITLSGSVVRSADPPYVVATVEDITPRRQAEILIKQIEASRRLEALGRMTGGIAHDFNNLLTIISGNLQLLEMAPTSERAHALIEAALKATEAGANLNQRLATFARRRRLAPAETDVAARVGAVALLLERTVGPDIVIRVAASAEPAIALVDPTEVDNAILNLALNARDAMPSGGTIEIETSVVSLVDEPVVGEDRPRTGDYVVIRVSDTGVGMSPEVQARAFDPFFTTKEVGRGTGLGLATLHGFVRQSGGFVRLTSEPGRGTTVSIHLPRWVGTTSGAAPATREPPAGRGERVLLVEDHPDVLAITRQRLAALGYDVVEASDAVAALARIEAGEAVDLVLSDVVMPGGLSGLDLARRLRKAGRTTPVLLTTGHSPEIDDPAARRETEFRVLRKPYTQYDLAVAIRAELDRAVVDGGA
jgi:PAS domain S-box-containing protein